MQSDLNKQWKLIRSEPKLPAGISISHPSQLVRSQTLGSAFHSVMFGRLSVYLKTSKFERLSVPFWVHETFYYVQLLSNKHDPVATNELVSLSHLINV